MVTINVDADYTVVRTQLTHNVVGIIPGTDAKLSDTYVAFGAHYDIKHVVVVDADVDIHDQAEVEWAIATRFQADRDLVVVSEAQGSRLDPSSRNGVSAKMGFDATIPLASPAMKFKRIAVPGEDAVDLARDIDAAADWRKAVT